MIYYKFAVHATYYISLILSYMLLVTMVGYFRALVAKLMGDDTAENEGFLNLNPAVHTDFFGLILLIFLGIGWGRQIPVNPANIHKPLRWIKLPIAMLSGVVAYMFFAVIGLVVLAFTISPTEILRNTGNSIDMSSPVISILNLFIAMCVFLAAMELVINIVLLAVLFIVEQYEDAWQYASYAILLIPIIIFLLYGGQIQLLLANGITSLASIVARLLCRA